jgi:hypothetical protein
MFSVLCTGVDAVLATVLSAVLGAVSDAVLVAGIEVHVGHTCFCFLSSSSCSTRQRILPLPDMGRE